MVIFHSNPSHVCLQTWDRCFLTHTIRIPVQFYHLLLSSSTNLLSGWNALLSSVTQLLRSANVLLRSLFLLLRSVSFLLLSSGVLLPSVTLPMRSTPALLHSSSILLPALSILLRSSWMLLHAVNSQRPCWNDLLSRLLLLLSGHRLPYFLLPMLMIFSKHIRCFSEIMILNYKGCLSSISVIFCSTKPCIYDKHTIQQVPVVRGHFQCTRD